MRLLDVNALIALCWPNHVHHWAAREWFIANHAAGWATCPVTESGFLRISSNGRITPDARPVVEAACLLSALRAGPGHSCWSDDISLTTLDSSALEAVVAHHQVTDAHLLLLAASHGGSLVTFDREAAELGERLSCPVALLTL